MYVKRSHINIVTQAQARLVMYYHRQYYLCRKYKIYEIKDNVLLEELLVGTTSTVQHNINSYISLAYS